MSKTANIPNVEHHIDEDGLKDTKTKVRFNPEKITKKLVEFYADKAGLDKDNYDVDAAVKEWREIIESGHGLALDRGNALAMEFVPVGATNHTPVVRVVGKEHITAFNMGLDCSHTFDLPWSIDKLYARYLFETGVRL